MFRFLQLLSLSIFLLVFNQNLLLSQSFTASQGTSDANITIDWSIDVNPCLLDENDEEYNRVRLKLLGDGEELYQQIFEEEDLEPFYGDSPPNFSYARKSSPMGEHYLTLSDININDSPELTIEYWAKRDDVGDQYISLIGVPGAAFNIYIDAQNQIFTLNAFGSETTLVGQADVGLKDWMHIALVVDDNVKNVKLYINGQFTVNCPYGKTLNANPRICKTSIPAINTENKSLAFTEVRVWEDIRTDSEINDNYLFNFPVGDNLMARWFAEIDDISDDLVPNVDGVNDLTEFNTWNSIEFLPTFNYSPIEGTFIHQVGPEANVNYILELDYGVFAVEEPDCGIQATSGSTTAPAVPYLQPSDDYIDKIELNWINYSDLPTQYELIRDDTVSLITYTGPFDLNEQFLFVDSFDSNNDVSIVSGEQHKYHLKMLSNIDNQIYDFSTENGFAGNYGSTENIQFEANNVANTSVELGWLDVLTLLNGTWTYEIWRDGYRKAVLADGQSEYFDYSPIRGDQSTYELRAVNEDGSVIAQYFDNVLLTPHGVIEGQVLTSQDLIPVEGVEITATRISNNQQYSATTDNLGRYSLGNIAFGIADSFSLEANYLNHTFSYPVKVVELSQNDTLVDNVVVLDSLAFDTGSEQISINSFVATPAVAFDKVDISWSVNSNATNTYVEFKRDSEVLFFDQGNTFLNYSIEDLGGAPGVDVTYQLRIYSIDTNGALTIVTEDIIIEYPEISDINVANLTVAEKLDGNGFPTGNIELTWTETSANIDGYALYRNDELIAQLDNSQLSYVDETCRFNQDYAYRIAKVRVVDQVTYIGEEEDFVLINLGSMPTVTGVIASELIEGGYAAVGWSLAANFSSEYNFTGYVVVRTGSTGVGEIVGYSFRNDLLFLHDFSGIEGENYFYSVALFKEIGIDDIELSDFVTAAPIDYHIFMGNTLVSGLTAGIVANSIDNAEVLLDWSASDFSLNHNGYIIKRGATTLDTVPRHITQYYDFVGIGNTIDYSVIPFKNIDGYEVQGETSTVQISVPSMPIPDIPAPENIVVTNAYPNAAKICWTYDPFIPARFIVYRDNVVLDTVSTETRSYFDFTDFSAYPRYTVKAYYDGPLLPDEAISFALGQQAAIDQRTFIYGVIRDNDTHQGIPFGHIQISVDGEPYYYAGSTDETGFYAIDIQRHASSYDIDFKITAGDCSECITGTLAINDEETVYAMDFTASRNYTPPVSGIAQIRDISAKANKYDMSSIIHWNMTSDNYNGIEVVRGLANEAPIMHGEPLYYVDSLGLPGVEYKYVLTPYIINNGIKERGESVDIDFTMPKLLPVDNLIATPISKKNRIQIEFGHFINNADKYLVLRNGELFDEINRDEPFIILDTIGVPGELYYYEVFAYGESEGQAYISEGVKTTAIFPEIGTVNNLTATAPYLENVVITTDVTDPFYALNHAHLTWEHEDENIDGFVVRRYGEVIATLDGITFFYDDYFSAGTHDYSVSAIKIINDIPVESKDVNIEASIYQLETPENCVLEERGDIGDIKITFDYNMLGADYFKISSNSNSGLIEEAIIKADENPINNSYTFIDKNAKVGSVSYFIQAYNDFGDDYSSLPVVISGSYPSPPQVLDYQVTDELTYSGEFHAWEISDEANIDGFEIVFGVNGTSPLDIPKESRELLHTEIMNVSDSNGDAFKQFEIKTYKCLDTDCINKSYSNGLIGISDYQDVSYNGSNIDYLGNVTATDGTDANTTLTWTSECMACTGHDDWFVYRNKEHIGTVPSSENTFVDQSNNLIQGASVAEVGKEYIYEVVQDGLYQSINHALIQYGDIGYSKRKGKIQGSVYVNNTFSGVPNVKVTATYTDAITGHKITASDFTLGDGSFSIEDLYMPDGEALYVLSAEFEDHEFNIVTGEEVFITSNNSSNAGNLIYDLNAIVVQGTIKKENAICGLPNIKVLYKEVISGITTTVDSTFTDTDGFYALVVNPNKQNLEQLIISPLDIENNDSSSGDNKILHDFSPKVFTSFGNFPEETELNFTDALTYPVTIDVRNACGEPIADQEVELRIYTLDGCYDETFQTTISGTLELDLAPYNYKVVVQGLVGSGVNNYENSAVNYLELRPTDLLMFQDHYDADGTLLDTMYNPQLIYHTAPLFFVDTGLDRFLCDDPFNPAIIEQGDNVNFNISIAEQHLGETCNINDGYIKVSNAAALNPIPDPIYTTGSSFPTYNWVAGGPNLIAPHVYNISMQYFNNDGFFQGGADQGVIVEGTSQLPGTGIQTVPTEDGGDVNLPLFVLRDPPGDAGYTELAAGTAISQELIVSQNSSQSGGLTLDGFVAGGFVALGGAFYQTEKQVGKETSSEKAYNFETTTTETYATSDSEDAIGRDASVIVGTGIATQYGLQRRISFDDNCTVTATTAIGYGLGDFTTDYVYTVGFIEDLIDDYSKDLIQIAAGQLELVRSDGSIMSEAEAIAKTETLKSKWSEVIHYFDVETTPHYVLCNDVRSVEEMAQLASSEYTAWRDGFCTLIGEYVDGEFIMDEEIVWSQDLINAYNNTIALTDYWKENPNIATFDEVSVSDYDSYDLYDASIPTTAFYHESLGLDLKSAEVVDIAGGSGGYSRTVEAQQSSYTNYSFNWYNNKESAAGAYIGAAADLELDFGLTSFEGQIFASDNFIGKRFINESSIGTSASSSSSSSSSVTYTIADDDPEDQVTALILQGPLQNHSPYFIRLGGQSSCPYETALTPNQDNDPLMVDDPGISIIIGEGATQFPPKVWNVIQDEAAIFEAQVSNSSATEDDRDIEIFLDQNSNPLGAIITVGGTSLNNGNKILTDITSSITQFITVSRPLGTPFYDFDDIRIGARPACGGEAEYITLSVQFKSECSPVSLLSPIDQFVVDLNSSSMNSNNEILPFEMRDFRVDYEPFEHIQLQYRNIGNGDDWSDISGGIFTKATLTDAVNSQVSGTDPSYFWEWDLEGLYSFLPDGEYQVRAEAFCGTSGFNISNIVNGEIRRSEDLFDGYPEPSDLLWTSGNEIAAIYVSDVSCQAIQNSLDIPYSQNGIDSAYYFHLVDLTTGLDVPFSFTCNQNKIALLPDAPMSDFDDHILEARYSHISDDNDNESDEIIHQFKVITQPVDWVLDSLTVTVYQGETLDYDVTVQNTLGSIVNNVSIGSDGSDWLAYVPSGNISVPALGQVVSLTFDGNNNLGIYTDTLVINGLSGRAPSMIVNMIVVEAPLEPLIDPTLPDSMNIKANWMFITSTELSIDTLDVLYAYMGNELRGIGSIKAEGPFFVADLDIYGDSALDNGSMINFGIWNADEGIMYDNIDFTNIAFDANAVRGTIADPEVLIVDDELFDLPIHKYYVDKFNTYNNQDGSNWLKAFDDLQEALALAQDGDTIWVANATYLPTTSTDRNASFEIDHSVMIYGGFTYGDTSLGQRGDPSGTILSGNIGDASSTADNVYHVIKVNAQDVLIDNFTIRDGQADGVGDDQYGSGIINYGGLSLHNCTLSNNSALLEGESMYNKINSILHIIGTVRIED